MLSWMDGAARNENVFLVSQLVAVIKQNSVGRNKKKGPQRSESYLLAAKCGLLSFIVIQTLLVY